MSLENLFRALEQSEVGLNVFSEEDVWRQVELGYVTEEMYHKSRNMEYNQFTACQQNYENDVDRDSNKNPPLLIARAIEQQQRYLMLHGKVDDLHMFKMSCWEKMENKEISVHYQVGCSGSGNGRWNCVSDGSRKQVQQVM